MSERTLKEIALHVLKMYEDAEETVTHEYSGSIDADIKKLKAEVSSIRQEIEAETAKQPKIIMCKDCKWFRRWIDTEIEFCDLTESTVFATDYCSRAERREE